MQLLRILVVVQKHEHEFMAGSAQLCGVELGLEAFVGGEWCTNGCSSGRRKMNADNEVK